MTAAATALRGAATSSVLWAILGGLVIGALITLAAGHDPVAVYGEILAGALVGPNLAETVARAVPLVGMTLVAAIPLRGGMVNLGGQSAGFVAPVAIGFIVTGTGSFDAAFGFLVAMTALSVVVATTISTAQPRLAPQPA